MISEEPPICKGCGEAILIKETSVQALNGDWHPKCFRCSSCGQRLSNWYFQNEGNLYCRRDYWSKFGDRCNACSHIISGPVMVAGEHNYHPECFVCSMCQRLIGDGEAYALVERSFLFCGQCYRVGAIKPSSSQAQETKPHNSPQSQTPRRKPHSIHMVEIPPTPEYQSEVPRHHHQQQQQGLECGQKDQCEQQHEETGPKHRKLQLSLQTPCVDMSTAGWRGSLNYRHSLTVEGGRLTPCVQISELDTSPELYGLAVGDKILEVNGTAVRDKSIDEIKTLLTNDKKTVHVMVERDLSPLRLSPEEDSFAQSSSGRNVPSRNASSDDLNSPSTSEGETVVVLNQTVRLRPKGSLRARRHSPTRRRSKSPSPCPSAKQKSIDLSRSHSFSTRQDHRAFRAVDLIIGEVLGQGFFGQALKAIHRVTGEQMVLKELHNFDESAQNSFLREVSMLRSLSHPCVLKFLGVLYRDKKLNLVTEYIDGGTLSELLLDHTVELSWKQRIVFAKDIASGMNYLHSMNIIHRDLNSQNCLVRKDQTVVVADFGLAKIFPRHDVSQFSSNSEKEKEASSGAGGRKKKRFSRRKRGTVVGNPYWMAPEMMTKGVYDEKVDVFSFGIIVCETIARVSADPDYLPRSFDFGLNAEAFHLRFCQGDVPEPYFMLAVLCSQIEPDQRPSFEKIHVLCEALHLHVEHGMAVPVELQGSTVELYRSQKEKMYGQNYTDVDSCTQVSKKDDAMDADGSSMDNLRNGDSDQGSSLLSASDGKGSKSCLSSDDTASNTEDNGAAAGGAKNTIPDCSEKSKSDSRMFHESGVCVPHLKYSDVAGEKSHSQTLSSATENRNGEAQDLRVILDDEVGDASVATTNEDYAYFSCSSESPSVSLSSPCLSVEDFVSCKSSPVSSGTNIANQHSVSENCHDCINSGSSGGKTASPTLHQVPSCSAFSEDTSSQDWSCCTDGKLRPAVAVDTEVTPKHSSDILTKNCSPSGDYHASNQLKHRASMSSPPPSYVLADSRIDSSDCDA